MHKLLLTAAAITLTGFGMANAAETAGLGTETMLGKTEADVTASLTAMGYEVRKAEVDDGKIEVYFVKGTAMGEVYVSEATGMITKMTYETE